MTLMEKVLFEMVQKTMDLHVLFNLENVTIIIASFDFLMFRCGVNTFVFIINYLDEGWIPRDVIVVLQLQALLENLH